MSKDSSKKKQIRAEKFRIKKADSFKLSDIECDDDLGLVKEDGQMILKENRDEMFALQEKLYAENKRSLLIVFQAMDAAGKDGAIKHVMRGLNPQGVQVTSFKKPSEEEIDRDYMWRVNRALPRRGEIGIFNRSHYEEVVVTQLHNLVKYQQIPSALVTKNIWKQRYEQIRNWEKYLTQQGFTIIKFFLHVSKEEQRERLLARIEEEDKNWKFSSGDLEERKHWDEYQELYEKMIQETSTENSPWYVVPADKKWFTRAYVSQVVLETLREMDPQIPELAKEEQENLQHWREVLEAQEGESSKSQRNKAEDNDSTDEDEEDIDD